VSRLRIHHVHTQAKELLAFPDQICSPKQLIQIRNPMLLHFADRQLAVVFGTFELEDLFTFFLRLAILGLFFEIVILLVPSVTTEFLRSLLVI
jgi:hypothetical protein